MKKKTAPYTIFVCTTQRRMVNKIMCTDHNIRFKKELLKFKTSGER